MSLETRLKHSTLYRVASPSSRMYDVGCVNSSSAFIIAAAGRRPDADAITNNAIIQK